MTDYRRFENGQWHNANGYAPDRANGCLVALMWLIVCIILALAVLSINGLMGNVISILVSLARGA